MKPHFICTGECKGMSANAGSCQTYGCSMYHKDLVACRCVDWQHAEEFREKPVDRPSETSQQ